MVILLRIVCVVTIGVCIIGLVAPLMLAPLHVSRAGPASTRPGAPVPQPPQSPVIEALDSTLKQQDRVWGNFGKQLQQDLARADESFQQTKRRNREAMQQANRRVRPRRSSPHLLLILVQGLTTEVLHCYNKSAQPTPGYDHLAERGVLMTQFAPGRNRNASNWFCLVEGETTPDVPRPQSLVTVLWQAGYDTAFVGDASPFAGDPRNRRFDHWYGFRTVAEASERFPNVVWSDEQQISLKRAARDAYSGGNLKPSHQLLLEELGAMLSSPAQSRPVFAMVSIRAAGWTPAEMDAIPKELSAQLQRSRLTSSTVVMVAGVPDDRSAATPKASPLIVAWPGKFAQGTTVDVPAGWADLAATVCEIAETSTRQTVFRGRSQLNEWKAAAQPAVSP